MEQPSSLSISELREKRRSCKPRAYDWLYSRTEGPRPSEVDLLLNVDSELKRRMREDLEALSKGGLSFLYLERTYGLTLREIRRIAHREDHYLST